MLQQILDNTNPAAPLMSRPRFAFQVQLGADPIGITGEDRLGFGVEVEAANGFTITGCEAHAAVRMHATPATGSPWSSDHKGKYVGTTPSAWELRSS